MDKYLIHYFSGTGNTYHLAKKIESELKSKGYEVHLLNIEKEQNTRLDDYKVHIFCFPIYGFGTPSIMLRYISKLKVENGGKASIVCTSAGTKGQALSHVKHLLSQKGFDVFSTDLVVYTYNWTQILPPKSKETEERVFKAAEDRIVKIANKITNCESSSKGTNIVVLMVSWVVFTIFSKLGRRILGRTFIADNSCTSCGKCKNVCPVKAIKMSNGRPAWNINCENCQRCINMCPQKSIQLSIAKLALFVISELAPIFILIYVNNHMYHLPMIANIILYCIMFAINTIIADRLISIMERTSIFRKLFIISYTKKYRRNIAKGFDIYC